ncbi:MAG: cation:proton antiporter, partial [Deltaproteobacteria bacterium]|nr:cation:proton antiporter [Deltaproteobacteria bacterium]
MGFLNELLVLLAVATGGVALFERLRLPAIAGFLVMGALVGPGGIGLIGDPERVREIADLGVVFLLFEIGLELPLGRLRLMWRPALVSGGLQVGGTLVLVSSTAMALGLDWRNAVVLGALVAMSSTALVMRLLSERGEVHTPQGQLSIGILLFQDLCVVPFLLLVPILADDSGRGAYGVGLDIARALLALAVFFVVARFVLPPLLDRVARMRSRELFTMVALLTVLGSAVIAEKIGLTLSVGAFVGGLVLSMTPYARQLFAEVVPLRGLLIGVFFTAVGMLFDWRVASEQWSAILAYTGMVVFLKAGLVILIVAYGLGHGVRLGVLTGLTLAQTGEFSFVLAVAAAQAGLLDDSLRQVFVAGSIATLLLTPFLVEASPRIAAFVARGREVLRRDDEAPRNGPGGHVVLIGFGLGGQNLARVLKSREIPFVAIEGNAVTVRAALRLGQPVIYGDATRPELLHSVDVANAKLVVVAISDAIATREVVARVREISPSVPVLARTPYVLDVDGLERAGATQVVVEELEATLELIGAALKAFGISSEAVARFAAELREEGYVFLRAPETILDPWLSELLEGVTSQWVEVPESLEGDPSLHELGVRARTGATIVAVERRGAVTTPPEPTFRLRAGDRLLTLGSPDTI